MSWVHDLGENSIGISPYDNQQFKLCVNDDEQVLYNTLNVQNELLTK